MKEKTASSPSRIIWPYDHPNEPVINAFEVILNAIGAAAMCLVLYGLTVILFGLMP